MIIAVQGSRTFSDYNVFLRAMAVGMSSMKPEDNILHIYSVGPARINSMAMEFVNLSEKGMKLRGKKIKMFHTAPNWLFENINTIDYFAYMSSPDEPISKLTKNAQEQNIEVGIFRY